MRLVGLALGSCVVGASACSLLLDTGSLQQSGAGGATGSGGADAMAPSDASGESVVGKRCMSDTDCLPSVEIDGCTFYPCGADMTCQPPRTNSGNLGVVSAGTVETVMNADDIGYPSLLADGGDVVMAVWHKTGTTTDVLIRKYPAYPLGGAGVELSAIAPGMFKSYASSPGIITRTALPRKMRLLLAAERTGDAGGTTGMRLVDVDVPAGLNNNLRLSTMQPVPADLGVTGYDTRPRSFPPRMMANGFQEPAGMWVQQQKLYYFDGAIAAEAFSTKRVLGFMPLAPGGGGVHAALQTSDIADGGNGTERTELWSQGSATLVSLDGDQPGPRRGVSSTFTNESGLIANLVGWAFAPRSGIPALNYTAALCGGASCSSVALSMSPSVVPNATFPELTSVRVTGSMVDRDVLQAFQIAFAGASQPIMAGTALFGSASRFTIPSIDLTKSSSKAMNPTVFPVDIVFMAGDVLGPSSVAITSDGQMLIAWVVRPTPSTAVLRARRYLVKTCP
jgi:hypothetical protein